MTTYYMHKERTIRGCSFYDFCVSVIKGSDGEETKLSQSVCRGHMERMKLESVGIRIVLQEKE